MPAKRKKPPARHVSEPSVARTQTIQASTFKATCLELMDEIAVSHREVIVTKHGRPVVSVGPAKSAPPSPFGFLRGTVVDASGVMGAEHKAWRGSLTDPLD